MAKTLYVGNLSWNTSESDLERLVGAHAEVSAVRVASDRETGRSRGFGFVDVPEDKVQSVIEALNGTEFDGRQLTVSEARPREDRPSGGRRY